MAAFDGGVSKARRARTHRARTKEGDRATPRRKVGYHSSGSFTVTTVRKCGRRSSRPCIPNAKFIHFPSSFLTPVGVELRRAVAYSTISSQRQLTVSRPLR